MDSKTELADSETQLSMIEIGIVVRNLEQSTTFYGQFVGLEHEMDLEMASGATMRRMKKDRFTLKLLKYPVDPPHRSLGGGPTAATGIRYWTLIVDDLDAYVADARRLGIAIPMGPVESRPGIRIAMFEDPDGNWIELLERDL